ncbi:MAG: metallophosphoesterase [Bacillota bacterium]
MVPFVLSMIFLLTLILIWYHDTFSVKRQLVSVTLPHITSPLRICQLTDLHGHMFKGSISLLIQCITDDHPDVVVLTGDMIDRKTKSFNDALHLSAQLATLAPVYFVMGNHEVSHPRQSTFLQALTDVGVIVLHNTSVKLHHQTDVIHLCGVGDASSYDADLSRTFSDVPATEAMILLSHTPDIVDQLTTEPVTLILSGHTHGGQIRLPFIGAVIAPGHGLFPRRTKGLYPLADKRQLYIDSGLGMSRIPVRFCNQSQYSVIDLRPEEE